VKVTARIESGAMPFSWMSQAMRLVMTRVLPEPAPARISNGPSVVSTAAALFGLRLERSGSKAKSGGKRPLSSVPFGALEVVGLQRCS